MPRVLRDIHRGRVMILTRVIKNPRTLAAAREDSDQTRKRDNINMYICNILGIVRIFTEARRCQRLRNVRTRLCARLHRGQPGRARGIPIKVGYGGNKLTTTWPSATQIFSFICRLPTLYTVSMKPEWSPATKFNINLYALYFKYGLEIKKFSFYHGVDKMK